MKTEYVPTEEPNTYSSNEPAEREKQRRWEKTILRSAINREIHDVVNKACSGHIGRLQEKLDERVLALVQLALEKKLETMVLAILKRRGIE